MKKRMEKTLEKTKFSGCPITTVSANPGGSAEYNEAPAGIEHLIEVCNSNIVLFNV